MEMNGETRIPAPREAVWEALNDPAVLKECISGCESLERDEAGDGFIATVKAKVGPVKATFKGGVKLENVNAPESYTITGEGKGGAAGFAKGSADVSLREEGPETVLTYAVSARVGGKMAQLGARLIDSTAKKYANEFFENFTARVSAASSAPPPEPTAPVVPTEPAVVPDPSETSAPELGTGTASNPSPVSGAEESRADEETPSTETEPNPEAAAKAPSDLKADATKAAVDATRNVKARRGLTPFTWVLIIILLGLGASLIF